MLNEKSCKKICGTNIHVLSLLPVKLKSSIMYNKFKVGEFVTVVRRDGNPFKFNNGESHDELKGIVKVNRPAFDKNKNYVDRKIGIHVIGRIGRYIMLDSKIIRK